MIEVERKYLIRCQECGAEIGHADDQHVTMKTLILKSDEKHGCRLLCSECAAK